MNARSKTAHLKMATDAAKSSVAEAPVSATCACCKDAASVSPMLVGICASTSAQYRIGKAERPPISHDNGFLQNPMDPSDPHPIPTVSPGIGDRASLLYWQSKLEAAEAAQGVPLVPHNDIPDGLAAYRHFLYGNGADRTFSYERFVANDASGKIVLTNGIRDIQLCVEKFYKKMLDDDPSIASKRVEFALTGTAIPVGADMLYPYPSTENWQKAIGAHSIWLSGTIVVDPAPCSGGGDPKLKMCVTLHAEDRYNFNPGNSDIATGTPDADNGRFEATGLAHQYMNYAILQRDVTWMLGHPEAGTSLKVNDSRQRKPSDNLRVRNRI